MQGSRTPCVRSIRVSGLHGRFDLDQAFTPSVNVIYGRNGSGKTTLLHIIANLLSGDYERFAFLQFSSILLDLGNGTRITLSRIPSGEDSADDRISVAVGDQTLMQFTEASVRARDERSRRSSRHIEGRRDSRKLEPLIASAYFPAFRTMIEAWGSYPADYREANRIHGFRQAPPWTDESPPGVENSMWERFTELARTMLGPFTPRVTYPSPADIERSLTFEIERAILKLAAVDRELLAQTFIDVFAALSDQDSEIPDGEPESILADIRTLSQELEDQSQGALSLPYTRAYSELAQLARGAGASVATERSAARVLSVYPSVLRKRLDAHAQAFRDIERYLRSVNGFLEGKRIVMCPSRPASESMVQLQFGDGSSSPLMALSSGERQILTMIYAVAHMSEAQVVLVDEPEISLHVDWQRTLLREMGKQLPQRQIIVCTHSPIIGADYEQQLQNLELRPSAGRPLERHHQPELPL